MTPESTLLDDLRVVSFAVNLPGPAAAQRLRQMGAQVVKVEPPAGDPMATYSPAWYEALAAGCERRTIDVKTPEGRGALDALLADADVWLTAHRPSALARLGLAPDVLAARHPRLCQVAVTGFAGLRADEAGHDLTYQAALGLVEPPNLPRTLVADLAGAERAVSAVLALLFARERSGRGGFLAVPLAEAASAFADPLRFGVTLPGSVWGGGLPEYSLYATRDGWVALAALEPRFRDRLQGLLGIDTREGYAAAFAGRSCAEWQAWACVNDLPLEAVRTRPE